MPKRRKKFKKMLPSERPPCPDPGRYTWVQKRNGQGYWRLNRGTVKPATLNAVCRLNADNTAITNQAAKRVLAKLIPFTLPLLIRNSVSYIAGSFKRSLLVSEKMNYSDLVDFDFQEEDYAFNSLVKGRYQIAIIDDMLHLSIGLGKGAVKRHSKLAEGYSVELIILFGDPASDKTLRVDSTASEVYEFDDKDNPKLFNCLLSLQLPAKKPWMAMLKVSCAGRYVDEVAKYHAMKVVKVGNGFG
ncbi:hypothetical protein [Paraflavitalea sp. CAU 1676]|uniref:hypothetical protein n=1 Tax=Paraflavitalea sp. CAU 1676 TaxID=3032598 RepID=UPI0023DB52AD|nr:hypothetical protein [Paraflavitalea sp. CAU 1676]MDF2193560.1 hypothetical protein [Paraflavitalea sp. CAU 1676]